MGVVNNRIDIDALAKSSGGGDGGGMTADALWTGTVTSDYSDIAGSLEHPITDYTFLSVSQKNGVNVLSGELLLVANMSDGANNINTIYMGNTAVRIRLGDGTVSISSTSTLPGITLLGIK